MLVRGLVTVWIDRVGAGSITGTSAFVSLQFEPELSAGSLGFAGRALPSAVPSFATPDRADEAESASDLR